LISYFAPRVPVCQLKGRDYSRSSQALACPQRTLSARPAWGVLRALSLIQNASFVMTAAEAANCLWLRFISFVLNFLTDGFGSTSSPEKLQWKSACEKLFYFL
jgi:hypothetical protein